MLKFSASSSLIQSSTALEFAFHSGGGCIRHQRDFKFVLGRRARFSYVAAAFCVQLACYSETCAATSGPRRTEVHAIIIHTISGPRCVDGHVVYSGAPGDT